jgi:hypothetical protein
MMFKRRPSPASLIAVLALFVALGGTAVAANYVITSTRQIKPSVLRRLRGKRGPQGPQGAPGTSAVAALSVVVGPENTIFAGDAESSVATCPAGWRVLSGGGSAITGHANGMAVSDSSVDRQSWFVVGGNTSGVNGTVQAVAYCAPSGQAVAASRSDAHKRALAEAEASEQRVEQAIAAGR